MRNRALPAAILSLIIGFGFFAWRERPVPEAPAVAVPIKTKRDVQAEAPRFARARPGKAVPMGARLEVQPEEDDHGVRLIVSLQNLAKQPLKLCDYHAPDFHPYVWLTAKVNGADAEINPQAGIAAGPLLLRTVKSLEPGESLYFSILISAENYQQLMDSIPFIITSRGKQTVEVRVSPFAEMNQLGAIDAALIEVDVPDAMLK